VDPNIFQWLTSEDGFHIIISMNEIEQATREELLRLFQASESMYFDETTIHQSDYKDLDLDFFNEFLRRYMDIHANESEVRNYLKNLHLID